MCVSQELATAAAQSERRAMQDEGLRRATVRADGGVGGAVATAAYACELCGGRRCVYVTLVGARDIGKGETWGSKDKSAGGLRITCSTCGHEWRREF